MIQSIANVICESGGMVLLKCNKELSTYYEHIGFERIDVNESGILNIDKVIQYYKEIHLRKKLLLRAQLNFH